MGREARGIVYNGSYREVSISLAIIPQLFFPFICWQFWKVGGFIQFIQRNWLKDIKWLSQDSYYVVDLGPSLKSFDH